MSQTCVHCGAPDNGQEVNCAFCGQALSPEVASSAVQCPQCRTANRGGRTSCVRCNGWLVMGCLFCGATSPVNAAACAGCHESFQGMAERKAARDRQQQTQSVIDGVVSVVGSIAGVVSGHPAPAQAQPRVPSAASPFEAPSGGSGEPGPGMPSH